LTRYFATDPQVLRLSVSAAVWRRAGARELLLMQRSDNGLWGLPGGYVEPGETVVQAVAREVEEETGVVARIGRLVGVYSDPAFQVIEYPEGRRVHAVNLCFEAVAVEEGGKPTTPEETLATGFFSVDALPQPRIPIHEIRIRDLLGGAAGATVR
jgi:ADP-ribose pyrophosphatase YjhB (NUDIX family)